MVRVFGLLGLSLIAFTICACQTVIDHKTSQSWYLMLAHDDQGHALSGSQDNIIAAVRNGCELRIAWGIRRESKPPRSVEHVADVKWVTVRNSELISAQIGDFLINLPVLGEPADEHPQRDTFGGTQQVVQWRANLQPNGTFDAVWYAPHSGEFITRRPQRFPMKWYADCDPAISDPLYAGPVTHN